jgi:hypothetical protein
MSRDDKNVQGGQKIGAILCDCFIVQTDVSPGICYHPCAGRDPFIKVEQC